MAPQAQSGGTVSLTYTVSNTGTRATREDRWIDRVFLSRDGSLDSGDYLLGSFDRIGALGAGESYQETLDLALPLGIEGDFTIIVETDTTSNKSSGYQSTILDGLPGLRSTSDKVPEFGGESNNRLAAALKCSRVPRRISW